MDGRAIAISIFHRTADPAGFARWFLMPAVTGWFRRWLDPVEGAGVRVSVTGAAVVTAMYAVTLTIFASVTWLQFWDYLQ